jgi:hypothetical protein
MSKRFDAATKEMLDDDPEAWAAYLGVHVEGMIRVIDTDLSTVSAVADKVYRVEGPQSHLLHVEMQASSDGTLPRRLLRYNALLDLHHDLRVWSIVLLLRPEADAGNLTGVLDLRRYDGRPIVEFHYDVVRAWQRPVEPLLAGGLATLPMAPLADVPHNQIPEIIRRIDARLLAEAPAATAGKIIEATLKLAGLRLDEGEIDELRGRLQTVNITTESSYYRLAVKEGLKQGKIEEAQRLILRLGQTRFGPPDAEDRAAIEAIQDVDRLEQLSERLLTVASWAELLAETGRSEASPS